MERPFFQPSYTEVHPSTAPAPPHQPHQDSAPLYNANDSEASDRSTTKAATSTASAADHQYSQPFPAPLANGSSPSNKTPKHPKDDLSSTFAQWITEWITDWWGIEIACWCISALSIVAIVVILETYKSQPIPEWHFGITINSFISIFATIGQMAMMKPTVECISQLKWLWFKQKQKLEAFQDFDDASRGPTGSLLLLWKLHGMHLVSLGAAITVIAAVFGPFSQQVVSYPLYLHPVGNATVPQVFNYTGAGIYDVQSSPATLASISEGLAFSNSTLSSVVPFCSTGNCTWMGYSSLGVCGSVIDLSSAIISNACNLTSFEDIFKSADLTNPGYPCFNYTLPLRALTAFGFHDGEIVSTAGNATLSNAIPSVIESLQVAPMQVLTLSQSLSNSPLLGTIYLMYQPDFLGSINSTIPSPVAYGLNLNLCIQTYSTTVANGLTNTTVLSSQILETPSKIYFEAEIDTSLYLLENGSYMSVGGKTFGAPFPSVSLLNAALEALIGECYNFLPITTTLDQFLSSKTITQSMLCDQGEGLPFLQLLQNSTDPLSAVTNKWDNLAISMTNAFRTGAGGDTQVGEFEGKALAPVAFVETNYFWLILPITLVFLTGVFLMATILKNQRLGSRVWKSSNFGALQGLDRELHITFGGSTSISEMEEKAKKTEMRFDMGLNATKVAYGAEYRLVELG